MTPLHARLAILAAVAGAPALAAQELFTLRLDGPGQMPASVAVLRGTLSVVSKNGVPMLRATTPAEFVVILPAPLPQDFTIEFDIIPKGCCLPEDLGFEGTARLARTTASAHILWHPLGLQVMGGGGPDYNTAMPSDLQGVLRGTLTSVVATFEGETVKLYTNGRRLFTLTDRRFVRSTSLRVFLGGQDAAENAVHLARLRIIAGVVPPVTTVASRAGTTVRDPAGTTATAPTPLTAVPVAPQTGTITPMAPPPAPAPTPVPVITTLAPAAPTTGTIVGMPTAPPPLPPRTLLSAGFLGSGVTTSLAPRAITSPSFTGTGIWIPARLVAVSTPGFAGVGSSTGASPSLISLSATGFAGTGGLYHLAIRTISSSGFAGMGASTTMPPLTLQTAGFSGTRPTP